MTIQPVTGSPQEIQEVKNAFAAYSKITEINTSSLSDLLKMHAIMTCGTSKDAGSLRTGEEGVFADGKCIFVAPPPNRVPGLMQDLLGWMQQSAANVPPLIRAAVFHYEFVFIHPFSDGNGRMARLWHAAILCQWKEIFRFIPLESQIEKKQQRYYDNIAICHINGNSDVFIDFMLELVSEALDEAAINLSQERQAETPYARRLLKVMHPGERYTAPELMRLLELKSRETLRRHYLRPAIASGYVQMTIPEKPNSQNQMYVRTVS